MYVHIKLIYGWSFWTLNMKMIMYNIKDFSHPNYISSAHSTSLNQYYNIYNYTIHNSITFNRMHSDIFQHYYGYTGLCLVLYVVGVLGSV